MFCTILLYVSLFVTNDTIKPIIHHPVSINASQPVASSLYQFTDYTELDSIMYKDLPSVNRLTSVYPPQSGFQVLSSRVNTRQVFIAILLLLSLVTVALVRAGYPKEFSELFSVLRSMSLTQQIYRVQTNSLNMPLAVLTLNSVLSFSLSAYFIMQYKSVHINYTGITLFLLLTTMVSLLFIYRLGSGLFTGMLFPVKKEMSFYSFCTLQLLRISGIALLPLNILFAFGNATWHPWIVVFGVVAVSIFLGLIYLRGFMITKDLFRQNKFHFLLYICTLEIAPAMTIIKFLMTWVKR